MTARKHGEKRKELELGNKEHFIKRISVDDESKYKDFLPCILGHSHPVMKILVDVD